MSKQNKRKKWILPRHNFGKFVVGCYAYPKMKLKYGIKIEPFKDANRQYLILYNHQTAHDQFFVGWPFRKQKIYYVASEDIFSLGFLSKVIKYLVAPIPIKKQTTDTRAVMNCAKVVKEGGSIAIAPEGNRTFSGKTEYIKDSLVKLIRLLKLPIAIFLIEGGYGVHPRWSDVVRKGKITGGVKKVIEYEEYSALSDDELYALIKQSLYVNEAKLDYEYKSKKSAEYLERAMYVCPYCGLTTYYSQNDWIICSRCGKKIQYLPTKELRGVGHDFPFTFVNEWYEHQNDYIRKTDLSVYKDKPAYTDTVQFSKVFLYKNKRILSKSAEINLYYDKVTMSDGTRGMVFDFDSADTITVLGKNKLNIYYKDTVYQIKGDVRFNALRYVNFFYKYKNLLKGESNEFLGL